MGSAMSNAFGGIGATIGNAVATVAKSMFSRSCKDICSGFWEVGCFIEHVCTHDLIKLLILLALWYLTFLFLYPVIKLGICQCMTKCMCKMCWRTCEAFCSVLGGITCFCWRKIRNTKRVYRGRRLRDVEAGYSTDCRSAALYGSLSNSSFPRKRKLWERRQKRRRRRFRKKKKKNKSSYAWRRRRSRYRKTARSLSFPVGSSKSVARMSDRVLSRTNQGSGRKKIRTSKRRRLS